MKFQGKYSFKTAVSKMILISDDEEWIRRNVFNTYNPSYSNNFLLKQWFSTGDKINYSIPPKSYNYKNVIVTDRNNSKPSIVIGLSDKNAIVIQTWTGTDKMQMSAVLLKISGTKISSDGYTLFDNCQYPITGGRLDNKKAFLLDYLHGRILSVTGDDLQIQNKPLNRQLINVFYPSYVTYLSRNSILLLNIDYQNTGINLQIVTIDENDNFNVYEPQHFDLPNHLNSTDIRITKLSGNQCFIAYIKKLNNSGWNFTIEGRIVSVSNNTIALGDPITLLDYQTTQNPPLTDAYIINDPFYLTTLPNQNTIIAWYLHYKTRHDYFTNPDLPSTTTIQAQVINISGSSITTQTLVDIEDAIQDTQYSYFYSIFNLGFIPVSNNSFLILIDHGGLYGDNNLPRYILFNLENNNLVQKKKENITSAYDFSGSFTKDYDFLTLAMGNTEANGQFGRYTVIPPIM